MRCLRAQLEREHPDDVASVEVDDPSRVAWLSQTTLSVDETYQTVSKLRENASLVTPIRS